VWCIAMSYTLGIFWSHGSLYAILRFLKGLYIPYLAFSRLQCFWVIALGGINDPYV
jgi:hypothetical protein